MHVLSVNKLQCKFHQVCHFVPGICLRVQNILCIFQSSPTTRASNHSYREYPLPRNFLNGFVSDHDGRD